MSSAARRGALAGGLAAVAAAVYVGATVLGGLLDPGYSHVAMHVSELTSSHAPNRAFLATLYAGYNLALAGAGLALLRSVVRTRALVVASGSLVVTGAVGAAATAVLSPVMGLLQGLSIGTFLLWLLAVAWYGLRRAPAITSAPSVSGSPGSGKSGLPAL